jgi:hypothetical protein
VGNGTLGLTYDNKSTTFKSSNFDSWQTLHTGELKKSDQRFEVWLADVKNNHAYKVLFLIATSGLTTPVYAIIVTEY